jgi:hypothetical protein
MPSVIDAPERVEHEEHASYKKQPPVRKAHPGFWYTVLRFVKRHRIHTPQATSSSSHGALHPMETPADLLAREYPTLYIRAYAGV